MRQLLSAALAAALLSTIAFAQSPWTPPYVVEPSDVDSGYIANSSGQSRVVFHKRVTFQQTSWLQLRFEEGTSLPPGSFLRMTSTLDGAVQRHDGRTVADWFHYSAAFNGGEVLVELVAGPRTVGNRVAIKEVHRGLPIAGPDTICGPVDNRALSNDPRQGRLFRGCTGWMIERDVMLTAGHCVGGTPIIEFNVPLSTSNGSIVRSHPDDQYPFTTLQSISNGIGADWAVNRVGPNSNHGQLPTQRNGGQWYQLGAVPGSPAGNNIRITGYGSTTSPVSPTWYLVQKTHVGTLAQIGSTSLCYVTDTTGGNSGSPVIHENTGNAIGIHTHGGCSSSGGGCNSGTRIDRADLQRAIQSANPNMAAFTPYGRGCPAPVVFYELFDGANANDLRGLSFRMSPSAGGGWTVSSCTSNCFDSNFSNNLNLGDDQLARNLQLGFAFPLTGIGGSTTAIDVDSNGWIGLISGQHAGSDFTESVAELLAEPARLAACWDDLNPSRGGGVYFDQLPGKAMVTWYQVPEYSATGANTVQVQFFPSGDIILSYGASNTVLDGLAGFSAGNGAADPGGIDLSSAVPFTTGSGGTPVAFGVSAPPVLGTTIDLELSSLPPSTVSAFVNLGLQQQSIPLDSIGMTSCMLWTTLDDTFSMSLSGGGARVQFGIPNVSALIGQEIYGQGVVLAPGMNPLGVLTSNGGILRLGN